MIVLSKKLKFFTYFAVLFGVATIFSGAQNLFNENVIRTQGNIIPVVLWFNFIAGFVYLIIAFGTIFGKRIILRITSALSALNIVVLFYLLIHISNNQAYEIKTLIAMSFRTVFWFIFYILLSRSDFFKVDCRCG